MEVETVSDNNGEEFKIPLLGPDQDDAVEDTSEPATDPEMNVDKKANQQRKRAGSDVTGKPVKRKKVHGPVQPKTAVSQLNELKPGLIYKVLSQSGPDHQPVFEVAVELNGEVYTGKGSSKKEAKHAAAKLALTSFVQFKNPLGPLMDNYNEVTCEMDFTSDETNATASFDAEAQKENASCGKTNGNYKSGNWAGFGKPLKGGEDVVSSRKSGEEKNPVMVLNELRPGVEYKVTGETGEAHAKQFTVSLVVDGQTFEGLGSSKRNAKASVARKVLISLFGIPSTCNWVADLSATPDSNIAQLLTMPQVLSDRIAWLVQSKLLELTKSDPSMGRRKMLAGIVMTTGSNMEDTKVICIATGTKCISGEHLSVHGLVVNDCHAEIVSRRCLVDYIYNQLEYLIYDSTRDNLIFEPILGEDGTVKGYKLKDNVKFHLYINSAPCGDARIFSPHEAQPGDVDKHPNRKARGLLRSKIESGEGTIPVKPSETLQTWDAIMAGQRLLTMSCSDKIARWNVLGLQGNLLNNFIEPIYLDSIVLGGLFHPQHLYRAVAGRIADMIQGLPPPFKHNKPQLSCISSVERRQAGKAPVNSLNWTLGQEKAEVINASTGKNVDGTVSRLAKRCFFTRFTNLCGKITTIKNHSSLNSQRYIDAKLNNADYNAAKAAFVSAFQKADLGSWVPKPPEQNQFELLDSDPI